MSCKCIKCNKIKKYESFKTAWMKGWDFLKEVKDNEYNVLGVCEECPTLTKQDELEFQENLS
jgi:hypothetical protein